MTDTEILYKAIEKAKTGGYGGRPERYETLDDVLYDCSILDIIFSHDFAKAFWGTTLQLTINTSHVLNNSFGTTEFIIEWKYHLQQMVLEKEPLKYIEKFLNEDK